MAKQKVAGLTADLMKQAPAAPPAAEQTSTQTVKIPQDVMEKMALLRVRQRRSNQDILLTALKQYLEQNV